MSYEDTCSLQDALKKWDQDDCGLDKAVMEKFKNRKDQCARYYKSLVFFFQNR